MKGLFVLAWEKLIAWCEAVLNEPEERLDPPHVYATPGTIGRGTPRAACTRRFAGAGRCSKPLTGQPNEASSRLEIVLVAWDGSAADFWSAIEKVRLGQEIESDYATLCEILFLAQRQIHVAKHEARRTAFGAVRKNG